jgi:hypothetical protein
MSETIEFELSHEYDASITNEQCLHTQKYPLLCTIEEE